MEGAIYDETWRGQVYDESPKPRDTGSYTSRLDILRFDILKLDIFNNLNP
jgi:hypothetical protein